MVFDGFISTVLASPELWYSNWCCPSLTGGDGHGWRRVIVQGAFDCGTNRNSYISGRLSLVAKCRKMLFESVVVRMDKFGV